jgi:hypothetical protein
MSVGKTQLPRRLPDQHRDGVLQIGPGQLRALLLGLGALERGARRVHCGKRSDAGALLIHRNTQRQRIVLDGNLEVPQLLLGRTQLEVIRGQRGLRGELGGGDIGRAHLRLGIGALQLTAQLTPQIDIPAAACAQFIRRAGPAEGEL